MARNEKKQDENCEYYLDTVITRKTVKYEDDIYAKLKCV